MKILTFTITVEANEYGEAQVPYLKYLLGRAIHPTVAKLHGIEYLPEVDVVRAESIEYEAYEEGRMEL